MDDPLETETGILGDGLYRITRGSLGDVIAVEIWPDSNDASNRIVLMRKDDDDEDRWDIS